ncbi:MAG TPA: ABC transporter permease [Dongiaceae bacterium]|jgi:NitT/TauT family transport system permease protein|nr:ABC transporter permease [Dongiaceae bacterium]
MAALVAALFFLCALLLSLAVGGGPLSAPAMIGIGTLLFAASNRWTGWLRDVTPVFALGSLLVAWRVWIIAHHLNIIGPLAGAAYGALLAGLCALAWVVLEGVSAIPSRRIWRFVPPVLFGVALLYLWEVVVAAFNIPKVLLPTPSQIGAVLIGQADVFVADFRVTFLRAVLAGFVLGNGLGFLTALAIDRLPFLQRGLLPLGNLVSAVPIVGIAPIMVMWFGFGWQSKTAVIVVMIFFPMLVNATAGLAAADPLQRDLMRSYGASYARTLWQLRFPAALPFLFNALKINSTLALIGAIVAEFFGSPIAGMGFRISVEIGRLNTDMVWATIAVAAVAGSLSYGVLALLERQFTYWHSSYRSR